jgi:hypothetical protein
LINIDQDFDDGNCFGTITEEEIAASREQERRLDGTDYQRQAHQAACVLLQIKSPDRPRSPGMPRYMVLFFWQPAGIKALIDFENSPLRGGVLADAVGTGKTWESIGLPLARSN